jgi:hypothetical protein
VETQRIGLLLLWRELRLVREHRVELQVNGVTSVDTS